MTIIRVSAERGGGSEWRVAPPAPGPLVGQQPVTAPRQRSPGGRGALEAREPRGQAQRTEGGTGGREPPSSPPLLLFLNPGLLLTSSALIINGLTTLGQARQLKIKRKTGKHCLLTMLLIGGVNFNGLTGAWEGGFPELGLLLLSPVMLTQPSSQLSPHQKGTPQGRGCVFIYLSLSPVPGTQ